MKFSLVCANENHVRILLPVARALSRRRHDVHFLSLDAYYSQNAGIELRSNGIRCDELKGCFCKGRWFSHRKLRADFCPEALAEVENYFVQTHPDCVVLGQDVEGIEQYIVRAAERYRAMTVRIQDGNQHAASPTDFAHGYHYLCPGDGGCDLICLWGDKLAKDLPKIRGIHSKIAATGNPRYDLLAEWSGYRKHSGKQRVLLGLQCFSRHMAMTPAQEIGLYERLVRQLLGREDVEVMIKPHPQQTQMENYRDFCRIFNGRVKFAEENDSLELLKTVDMFVTISSTMALESALMGIPTARLSFLRDEWRSEEFVEAEREFLRVLHDSDFPRDIEVGGVDIRAYVEEQTNPIDGLATDRVVDAIEEHYGLKRRCETTRPSSPEVSALVILRENTSSSAVYSSLRVTEVQTEVVVIDPSISGRMGRDLDEAIDDARLRVIHMPGVPYNKALVEGIDKCSGRFLAKIPPDCVVLPGWQDRIAAKLRANPKVALVLGGFQLRDDLGISHKIYLLPESLTFRELSSVNLMFIYTMAFGVRMGDAKRASKEISESETRFEFSLMSRVVGDLSDRGRIATVPSALFVSPFSENTHGIPLDAPIVSLKSKSRKPRGARTAVAKLEASVIVTNVEQDIDPMQLLLCLENQSVGLDSFEVLLPRRSKAISTRVPGMRIISVGEDGATEFSFRNEAIGKAKGKLAIFVDAYSEPVKDFICEHIKGQEGRQSGVICLRGGNSFPESIAGQIIYTALEKWRYLFLGGDVSSDDLCGYEKFNSLNLSIRTKDFLDMGLAFDARYETPWAADLAVGLKAEKSEAVFFHNPRALTICHREYGIHDILATECARSKDLLILLREEPELIPRALSVKNTEELDIEVMQLQLAENETVFDTAISVFERVQFCMRPVLDGESTGGEEELFDQAIALFGLICDHIRRKTLVSDPGLIECLEGMRSRPAQLR